MAFTGTDWGRRVLLTGLSPSATLSGFVALVSLDNVPVEAIDAGGNSALNGGGDLRFSTDDQGVNQLPLEVVSYVTNASAPSRSCQLWIRFPTYASGTREVYMFYKKAAETQPAVGAAFGRNAVWSDTAASYRLEDKVTNSAGGTSLTEVGTVNTVTGEIGDGQQITSNSNYLDTGISPSVSDGAVSLWAKPTNITATASFIFTDRTSTGEYFQVAITPTGKVNTRVASSSNQVETANNALSIGVWSHIVVTWGAGGIAIYVDGVSSATGPYTGSWVSNSNIMIGHTDAFALPFIGDVDEIALFNVQHDSDYISSEYDNQSGPAAFWTTGTPETPSGGGVTVTPQDINSAQTISLPSLTQNYIFSVDNIISSQLISQPTFTQANVLSVDGITSGHNISVASLTVAGALSVDNVVSSQLISSAEFVQNNLLQAQSLNSEQGVTESIIDTGLNLIVQSLSSAQSVSDSGMTQHHIILVDPLTNAQFIGVVNIGGDGQDIGTVTAAFKENDISVKYGILNITVNFKE